MILCLSIFSMVSNAQNEDSKGKSQKVIVKNFEIPCMCAGELLVGEVRINIVENKNHEHQNFHGELTGADSGDKYQFVQVDNIGNVAVFRVIGKDGLISYGQYDYKTDELNFYCTWWR